MKARGVVRITPADIGQRVTVRYLMAHQPGEPSMTDAVGILEDWRDGTLQIRTRRGELRSVSEASVIAGRIIFVADARTSRDLE